MSTSASLVTKDVPFRARRPQVPITPPEYDQALRALDACVTIDDAKFWSDKASALAAWAKIYHSRDIDRKAKILKLHAYRRMAELAQEIQKQDGKGRIRTILENQGLSVTEARQIDGVGRAPRMDFERAVSANRPPAPWVFSRGADVAELKPLRSMHTLVGHIEPARIASLIDKQARDAFREMIAEISEWLDELDQRLEKSKS